MQRPIQSPLLPETIQTILKCISSAQLTISPELSQELYQINLEARSILEKSGIAQKLLPPQTQNIGSQNNFELIQSMMNSMNNNNTNNNFNSPSKIFTQPIGVQNSLQGTVNLNTPVSLG